MKEGFRAYDNRIAGNTSGRVKSEFRVLRTLDASGEYSYAVHCVRFANGEPISHSCSMRVEFGVSRDDLRDEHAIVDRALKLPVLDAGTYKEVD